VRSHDERNQILQVTHTYSHVWLKYHVLYQMARRVRYLAEPQQWVPFAAIGSRVISPYLYPIEASVEKHMRRKLNFQSIELADPGRAEQ